MTKVISFANQKGGVGKTTLCLQTAFYLAEKKKKVLVIDLDPQGNTSTRLADKDYENGNKFTPNYHFKGTRTLDLFNPEFTEPDLLRTPSGVTLIWAYESDAELSDVEMHGVQIANVFKENLNKIKDGFEYVLIDCPPALGNKLISALASSTDVVSPVKLSGFAISGLEALINTIITIRDNMNPELKIAAIVANMMYEKHDMEAEFNQLKSFVGDMLISTRLHHRGPIDQSSSYGLPVWKTPYGYVAGREMKKALKNIIKNVHRA